MTTGSSGFDKLPEDVMIRLNQACNQFEQLWLAGERPSIESMLENWDVDLGNALVRELLPIEIEHIRRAGGQVSFQKYHFRFPDVDADWLAALLSDALRSESLNADPAAVFNGRTLAARKKELPTEFCNSEHSIGRFAPGTRFANRFRVIALLGRGGMGEVYRAEDLQLGQSVALKFLPKRFAADPQAHHRLIEEIRTARQVTHSNVCRIHDLGESDGQIFLTMEFVDGEDLAESLRRLGHFSQERAVEIGHEIACGLAAAHDAGVIHRDLKPSNIMIDVKGRAKILDFGLAGFQEELAEQRSICGTPAYMAPELSLGGAPSVRSDIYALGLVLYEIFTGCRAFDSNDLLVLKELHEKAVPKLPSSQLADMNTEVERIIVRCLDKHPQNRPASVADVLAALPVGKPSVDTSPAESIVKRPRRDERKRVTVMLGHLTIAGEAMDPESEQDAMDSFFELLSPIIEKYEGSIDTSIGEGIVALFGVPISHEDDAERALRSALEVRTALSKFNFDSGTNIGLRCGINTGLVVVAGKRSRGRRTASITGAAVNFAVRLKETSQCGDILVGAATHRLTDSLFEFETLNQISEEPGHVYRLMMAKSVPYRFRGGRDLKSELVGRASEIGSFRDAIQRLKKGIGSIVTLVGEAGLGKSRLVAELRKQTQSSQHAAHRDHAQEQKPIPEPKWVEGRCLSYGGSVAYHLWLDTLRSLLGVQPDTSPSAIDGVLREHVKSSCPDDFNEVLPYLAKLMSLPVDNEVDAAIRGLGPQGLKTGIFRSVQTLLRSLARQRGPLVVVSEDLHWADPTSLDLLEQLLDLSNSAPVMFVCVFRPDTEHGCWSIKETATRHYRHRHIDLRLEPLSATEVANLVGSYLQQDELSDGLGERIRDHADGNPFFVEEIIQSLIANEVIVRDQATDCWRVTQTAPQITIPDTLSGVLMARIDRLGEDTKRTLQLAAVIGRAFYYRVLEAIARKGRELDIDLLRLQRLEMIRERARLPELEYIFKHQLTQAAAYGSVMRKERLIFHKQVAETLEHLLSGRMDEHLEVLAHHWEQAVERDKAIDYLVRAGLKATGLYANVEALAYFQRALVLAEGTTRYEPILARRAKVRLNMFQGNEAADDYRQLLTLNREAGDREGELESLLGLAAALYTIALDDPAFALESLKRFEQAHAMACERNDRAAMIRSLVDSIWFKDFWPEYWDRAVAGVQEAWTLCQEIDDEDLKFDCRIALANMDLLSIPKVEGLVSELRSRHDLRKVQESTFRLNWRHLFAGNFRRCIEGCESSIALATKIGTPPVMYSTTKALAHLNLGQYDAAKISLEQEIAEEAYPFGRALQSFGEGMRLQELLAYDESITLLEGVVELAKQTSRVWLRLWAQATLSISLFRSQALDKLDLGWINEDLAPTQSAVLATAPLLLGEIALEARDLDEAWRQANKSSAEAETWGWRPSYVTALELQLRVLLQMDRPQDMISLADQAFQVAAEMEYRPLIWRILFAKAQALETLGRTPLAFQAYLASASVLRDLMTEISEARLKRGFRSNALVSRVLEQGDLGR